jgi:hypothetical protein
LDLSLQLPVPSFLEVESPIAPLIVLGAQGGRKASAGPAYLVCSLGAQRTRNSAVLYPSRQEQG